MTISSSDSSHKEQPNHHDEWNEILPGVWCVDELLTEVECAQLLQTAQDSGIQSFKMNGDVRHRQRVTSRLEVPELSARIWERVKDRIPQEIVIDENTNNHGLLNSRDSSLDFCGTWTPCGVHPKINVAYCSGKGHVSAHRDDDIVVNEHERSFLTINGYLAARPPGTGGATRFLADDIRVQGADISIDEERGVLCRVESDKAGKAVVFFHGLMHDGEPLTESSPPKWIFRSLVRYKRDPETAPNISEQCRLARELLKQAEEAETSGKIGQAIKLYSRAYKLDPSLEL